MSVGTLMVRDNSRMIVNFTEEANRIKAEALETSALVSKVTNEKENAVAVKAQIELKRVLVLAEKAKKAVKAPVIEYGKHIETSYREFTEELMEEMARVSEIVSDYQALERAKSLAAAKSVNAELSQIEREKAEAIAQAKSHEELDAIQAHFNEKAAVASVALEQTSTVEGQGVKTDWEITVTNPHELAAKHPQCVTITPKLVEIKQLLNDGAPVWGIIAKKVTKAQVRLPAAQKAIDV